MIIDHQNNGKKHIHTRAQFEHHVIGQVIIISHFSRFRLWDAYQIIWRQDCLDVFERWAQFWCLWDKVHLFQFSLEFWVVEIVLSLYESLYFDANQRSEWMTKMQYHSVVFSPIWEFYQVGRIPFSWPSTGIHERITTIWRTHEECLFTYHHLWIHWKESAGSNQMMDKTIIHPMLEKSACGTATS